MATRQLWIQQMFLQNVWRKMKPKRKAVPSAVTMKSSPPLLPFGIMNKSALDEDVEHRAGFV